MNFVTCPHCGIEVITSAEGECPSCRKLVPMGTEAGLDHPFAVPRELRAGPGRLSLTQGEIYYTAGVIYFTFLVLAFAFLPFLRPSSSDDTNAVVIYVIVAMFMFWTLATTIFLNLYFRKLLVIPTFLQCLVFCLTIVLIPLGIWGGIMLYRSLNRTRYC